MLWSLLFLVASVCILVVVLMLCRPASVCILVVALMLYRLASVCVLVVALMLWRPVVGFPDRFFFFPAEVVRVMMTAVV